MGSAGRRDKAGFASRLAVQHCTLPVPVPFRKVVVTDGAGVGRNALAVLSLAEPRGGEQYCAGLRDSAPLCE